MSSGFKLQHIAREGGLAIGHVVLQMDDALGPSGRARRVHPERHFVAVGAGFREFGGKSLQPRLGDDRVRYRVIAGRAIDHDQRAQPCILAGLRVEARDKLGVGDGNRGAGIGEIELQQVRRRQRVDQQRHEAGAHRAEECRRIGRRIVEKHQNAVAALQPERDKAVAPAAGFGAELGIAARSARADQRRPVAAALAEIVEQDAAGVVGLRNRKADFARTGAVGRHAVGDLQRAIRPRHVRLPPCCNGRFDAS